MRAAYFNATRAGLGGPSRAHRILIRDSHLLPPDLMEYFEQHRRVIGEAIGGEHAVITLTLLDTIEFTLDEIEAGLVAIIGAHTRRIEGQIAAMQSKREQNARPMAAAQDQAAPPEILPVFVKQAGHPASGKSPAAKPWKPRFPPRDHLRPPNRARAGPG